MLKFSKKLYLPHYRIRPELKEIVYSIRAFLYQEYAIKIITSCGAFFQQLGTAIFHPRQRERESCCCMGQSKFLRYHDYTQSIGGHVTSMCRLYSLMYCIQAFCKQADIEYTSSRICILCALCTVLYFASASPTPNEDLPLVTDAKIRHTDLIISDPSPQCPGF